jgi:hypothetical protein
MKLEFSERVFEKYTHIKFNENPSCGSFSQFCERALNASLYKPMQKQAICVSLIRLYRKKIHDYYFVASIGFVKQTGATEKQGPHKLRFGVFILDSRQ